MKTFLSLIAVGLLLTGAGCRQQAPGLPLTNDVEVPEVTQERMFTSVDLGSDVFNLEFTIPANMDVEYIPSLEALNIFSLDGDGSTRDRSMIFIRYFDASQFLTLSSVNVYETVETTVGREGYTARRYDIEKKSNVPDFVDQPDWRNLRHYVTDFRGSDGHTRYFVVAANPALDPAVYEAVLASMKIVK
ncbi:MAG: hypothetical protein AAB865_02415 [Patescibacteria group bacterium]